MKGDIPNLCNQSKLIKRKKRERKRNKKEESIQVFPKVKGQKLLECKSTVKQVLEIGRNMAMYIQEKDCWPISFM